MVSIGIIFSDENGHRKMSVDITPEEARRLCAILMDVADGAASTGKLERDIWKIVLRRRA